MKYTIGVFLLCSAFNLSACDICSAFSRIMPNDFKHSLGIHFNQRILEGEIPSGLKHLGHLNGLYSTDVLEEVYARFELRGRYRFSKRLSVSGILPFKRSLRKQNGVLREQTNGLGDPSVFTEYRPFLPLAKNKMKFMLNLRAGVKFPFGSTTVKYDNRYVDHDLQLGTGSYDIFLGSEAYIGTSALGLVVSQLYRYNTHNLSGYKYGNTFSALGLITHRWNMEDLSISAAAGAQYDNQLMDMQDEFVLEETQFNTIALAFKTDVTYKNIEVYGIYTSPVKQEFNELKTLPTKHLLQVGINYLIESK